MTAKHKWALKPIGQIFDTTSGGTPSRSRKDYYKGSIAWLKSGELNDNQSIEDSEEHITQEAVDNSSAKMFPASTVLMAMYGATTGKLGILRKQATTNQAVCGILPNQSFLPKTVFYYLMAKRGNIIKQSQGGAQPNISQGIIKQLDFPEIPLEEQERIVSVLETQFTRLDAVIKNLKATQVKLELYRRSVLKSAFSNELMPTKGSWQHVKIKEIAKRIQYGLTSQSGQNYLGPRYLRITDIQDRKVNWETVPFAKQKDEVDGYRLNKGDVVFARTGATVGKSFLIDECPKDAVFASYLIRITPDQEKILPTLLWFYFQSPMYWHKISEKQRGIGQPNVNGAILSNLSINLPVKIDDQIILTNEIEARFSTIDKVAEIIHTDLAKAEALRKSLLRAAFEGNLSN